VDRDNDNSMSKGQSEPPQPLRRRAFAASGLLHGLGITVATLTAMPLLTEAHWAGSHASAVQSSITFEAPRVPAPSQACAAPDVTVEAPAEEQLPADPAQPLVEALWPAQTAHTPAESASAQQRLTPTEWRTILRDTTAQAPPPPPAPLTSPAEVHPEPAPPAALATVEPSPIPGHNPAPAYPFVPWRRGIEGTVVVRLEIDVAGAVTAASVAASSGCQQLDDAAVEQLKTWQFAPAYGAFGPVRCVHRQAVVFRIRG
jgi:periplasmic protein TonB